jgi:hypothetical protein
LSFVSSRASLSAWMETVSDPEAAPPAVSGMPSALVALTKAGHAALDAVTALGRQASAPATLRAYRSDWVHYADWCARMGFVPVPPAPATVGAYLASLTDKAPTTIRHRLAALAKMLRFNDLPWNAAHRDIQGPLMGLLRAGAAGRQGGVLDTRHPTPAARDL